MPIYEYFCERCEGVFDAIRPMAQAAQPQPCPQCEGESPRVMSQFSAFILRDGYPRSIPDNGTYWHLGKQVKRLANSMKHNQHPELVKPKAPVKPVKGETTEKSEREAKKKSEIGYKSKWGTDDRGYALPKTIKKEKPKKTLA